MRNSQVRQRRTSSQGVAGVDPGDGGHQQRLHQSRHPREQVEGWTSWYCGCQLDDFFLRNLGSIYWEIGPPELSPTTMNSSIFWRKSKWRRPSGRSSICWPRSASPACPTRRRPWLTGTRRPAPSTCRLRSSTRTSPPSKTTSLPSVWGSGTARTATFSWSGSWRGGWGRRGRRLPRPPPPRPSRPQTPGTSRKLSSLFCQLRWGV